MEGAANECTRKISIAPGSTDCETLLNPLNWSTGLNVLAGRSQSSQRLEVAVIGWYEYDAATGAYTDKTGTALPKSTFASGC